MENSEQDQQQKTSLDNSNNNSNNLSIIPSEDFTHVVESEGVGMEVETMHLSQVHETDAGVLTQAVIIRSEDSSNHMPSSSSSSSNLPAQILASEDDSEINEDENIDNQEQQQQQQHSLLLDDPLSTDGCFMKPEPDVKEELMLNDAAGPHQENNEVTPNGINGVITLPFSFPGQTFSEQSQKLILNVWDFFKRARKDPKLIHSLRGPQDHASAALNVGSKTIGKIAKRVLRLGKLEPPGKKRNRPKTVLDSVGPSGEEVLRSIIREMYERRIAPTISLVLAEAKERLDFKGSTTSLRRILKRMGYKYGGINNSQIQSEKTNVSGWKDKSIKKFWKPNKSTAGGPGASATNESTTPTKNNNRKRGKTSKGSRKRSKVQLMEEEEEEEEEQSIEIIEAHELIESHELIQPHEVIIHYQKQDEADFLSQSCGTQMITVHADSSDLIQLQLNSDGETEPVQVVQWNYDCSDETTFVEM